MKNELQREALENTQLIVEEWYMGKTDRLLPLLDEDASWIGAAADQFYRGRAEVAAALERVRPDRAIVMPAGTPPHKHASATPAELRLQMCQCFKALSPAVEVSDWEIRQGGRSYTVHTLEMLRDANPGAELYLCVGSDMLLTFGEWYRWQDMLKMAALVVESRTGTDDAALHAAAAKLEQAGGTVLFAQAESYPCASSDIRSGKIPPEKWPEVLPGEVLAVIRKNKLYGAM